MFCALKVLYDFCFASRRSYVSSDEVNITALHMQECMTVDKEEINVWFNFFVSLCNGQG